MYTGIVERSITILAVLVAAVLALSCVPVLAMEIHDGRSWAAGAVGVAATLAVFGFAVRRPRFSLVAHERLGFYLALFCAVFAVWSLHFDARCVGCRYCGGADGVPLLAGIGFVIGTSIAVCSVAVAVDTGVCPCGYPLMPEQSRCPECGAERRTSAEP